VVAENVFPYFDLKEYYTRYISYDLNDEKRKGLELFLEKLKSYNK
jgi:chorismate dehydratase